MPRVTIAAFSATALLVLCTFTLAPSQVAIDRDQQKCIAKVNQDLAKVVRAQGKEGEHCLRDFAQGALGALSTDDCLGADRKDKVAGAQAKVAGDAASYCTAMPPSFGPTDVALANAAAAEMHVDLVHAMFGDDLDQSLLGGAQEAKCQQKLLKVADKCVDARLKAFVRCKKTELKRGTVTDATSLQDLCLGVGAATQPDARGRVAKSCDDSAKPDKIRKELAKCEGKGIDLASALPACAPATIEDAHACIDTQGACQTCFFLNAADGLDRDCDLFDDGTTNGSCEPVCGNGIVDADEQCDDGNTDDGDGCRSNCVLESCGDGVVDAGEGCDDGGNVAGDGCDDACGVETGYDCTGEPSVCTPVCGDGLIVAPEQCDDGGTGDGDGCGATCNVEAGYDCTGEPSTCSGICGDGVVVPGEACDDGGTSAGDGCDATCNVESGYQCTGAPSTCAPVCGDGVVIAPEQCDDDGLLNGDGCGSTCQTEIGYTCTGEPSACTPICGDGIVLPGEACDDGGTSAGDGCDASCNVETGYVCVGQPSACTPICGDGLVVAGEGCDDGANDDGDGCDATCNIETGFQCPGEPSTCSAVCGDGLLRAGEACDDGGTTGGDGCDDACNVETGFQCAGEPSICSAICGDGLIRGSEACDDGGTASGDGCRDTCDVELGYGCTGEPSACSAICGDGLLRSSEQCDDANTTSGDCCSSTCTFENGGPCDDGDDCTTGDTCSNGSCQPGTTIAPWVNEFDYDDNTGFPNDDREEFVEIAAPAGTDLGGYKLLAIEGNEGGFLGLPCSTGFGVSNGDAHWTVTIPGGTVVGDDTGTGIGFLVVCLDNTSTTIAANGDCDVTLSSPDLDTDSNLKNGYLVNTNSYECPDGLLFLNPSNAKLDAISYEGVIPNTGSYGGLFQSPAYSAGHDYGYKFGVSMEKSTSTLAPASSASEWRLSGGCATADSGDGSCTENSHTPGSENPGQNLDCGTPYYCGDGIVNAGEQCDQGAGNSNLPDATCRTDCTLAHCGDAIVDPGSEDCEVDDDCGLGASCIDCACHTDTVCGDGVIDAGEQCDDGDGASGDGCNAVCQVEAGWSCTGQPSTCTFLCGNGQLDGSEQCDDGGTTPGDGCGAVCHVEAGYSCQGEPSVCLPSCGNGAIDPGELCDDGDLDAGDGCTATCQVEPGFECLGEPSVCTPLCGNGLINPGEDCDEGINNSNDPDAVCRPDCTLAGCGDGITDPGAGEQCDDGAANSDQPDANCRTDCTLGRCGDGIIDPGYGEECELDVHCGASESCDACLCTAAPLGPLAFSPTNGPSDLDPGDDGQSSLLRLTPVTVLVITVTNGTDGTWASLSDTLMLQGGVVGPDGIAPLSLVGTSYVGGHLPSLGPEGSVCYKLVQDPSNMGFVDCDGGTNVDVDLTVDSNGTGADGPTVLSFPGGGNSGAGAAVIRVLVQGASTDSDATACADADYSGPAVATAFTTGLGRAVIIDARTQSGGTGTATVAQSGQPFDCNDWTENAGASITAPNVSTDVYLPSPVDVTMDQAQGVRLNDD